MSKKGKKVRPEGTLGIITGAGMMGAILLAGLLIPWFGKYDANEISSDQLLSPGGTHYFGTDMLGRDVFTRVFDAVFVDIGTAFAGVLIPLTVGTIVGTLLGISRNRRVNSFIGSLIDGINAFPFLILFLFLAPAYQASSLRYHWLTGRVMHVLHVPERSLLTNKAM